MWPARTGIGNSEVGQWRSQDRGPSSGCRRATPGSRSEVESPFRDRVRAGHNVKQTTRAKGVSSAISGLPGVHVLGPPATRISGRYFRRPLRRRAPASPHAVDWGCTGSRSRKADLDVPEAHAHRVSTLGERRPALLSVRGASAIPDNEPSTGRPSRCGGVSDQTWRPKTSSSAPVEAMSPSVTGAPPTFRQTVEPDALQKATRLVHRRSRTGHPGGEHMAVDAPGCDHRSRDHTAACRQPRWRTFARLSP